MKSRCLIVSVVLAALLSGACATASPAKPVGIDTRALVRIFDQYRNFANGSIILKNGCIMTVMHYPRFVTSELFTVKRENSQYTARVVERNRDWDTVLLKIDNGVFPSVALSAILTVPKDGEVITIYSYDQRGWARTITGIAKTAGYFLRPIKTEFGAVWPVFEFQSDVSIKRGMSGSAVWLEKDGKKEVIGFLDAVNKLNDHIAYAMPMSHDVLAGLFSNLKNECHD